jgi:hypothetical protein
MSSVISNLPGVDMNDPRVKDAMDKGKNGDKMDEDPK